MRKWLWTSLAALPLAVGGLVYANSRGQAERPPQGGEMGFVCPITGEELPCPNCCPLNRHGEGSANEGQTPRCCPAEK